MITGELKRDIDALWTEFWQGGITNPLTVIEQITFLMFARLLDINETRDENGDRPAATWEAVSTQSGAMRVPLPSAPTSHTAG